MHDTNARMFGGKKQGDDSKEGSKKTKFTWGKIVWIALGIWFFAMTWGFWWWLFVRAPTAMASYHARITGMVEDPPTTFVPRPASSGNPIAWGTGAQYEVRPKTRDESVDGRGIAFLGCIPDDPNADNAWVDVRTFCGPAAGMWEAYVVEYNASGFLTPETLRAHGVSRHGVRTAALRLGSLKPSTTGSLDARRLYNDSGKSMDDPGGLVEDYVQITGPGVSTLRLERQDPPGVIQYLVKVGREGTSFTIKHQNWKRLWIAPVHQETEYLSRLNNRVIPAQGISVQEAASFMNVDVAELQRALALNSDYIMGIPCQALMIKKGGEEFRPFHESVLWKPSDMATDEMVTIRLNAPSTVWGDTKPATIVVGIRF